MHLLCNFVVKKNICLASLLPFPVLNKPEQEIFPPGEYSVNKTLIRFQL